MSRSKSEIRNVLETMKTRNHTASDALSDRVLLTDYRSLVRNSDTCAIWTDALQRALNEHEIVVIPPSDKPYFMDGTVVIPGNRTIEAAGAVIRQTADCTVILFRNAHTGNGTHAPIDGSTYDSNITIRGGRWEESRTARAGYGRTGKYDKDRSFYGVSTLFFFNNIRGLTLENLIFAHTAGFSVQVGDLTDGCFEHIRFEGCFADGLHINGNSGNLLIRDIAGEVGDDLVALNMYDWQNSSVDFGPTRTVLCEDLELAPTSHYRALRIEPGVYYYDDGSSVDCGLYDAVFRNIRGIGTYKLYFQTPAYEIGSAPERGTVGSADNLYFEDITVDLDRPIDAFDEYLNADPIRGAFGAFEFGAQIGTVSFEHIRLIRYAEKFPNSYLVVCGPKSVRIGNREVFDPYLSCTVGTLIFSDIEVCGERVSDLTPLLQEVSFDDINEDGHSTASGRVERIILDGTVLR